MPLDTTRPALESVGDYDLVEKIAEGGMGAVYRGRERATGKTVAIKIVPPHMTSNAVLMKRFEQEYNIARNLDHPNIVRALAFGMHGKSPYLVMEFVEGESLGDRLEREKRLCEAEAIRIIGQVAQGLHRAHKQGLVHRDVKPDNILLTADGQVKLADLGLVKELETDLNLTRTGRGLGTPHFMAPEQFRNAKNVDARSDIYSMGATLYMMVTGELPFKSCGPLDAWMKKIHNELTPALELLPSLSERTDWAIRRAMSPDPHMRPGSCREFIEDLTGHSTRRLTPADTNTGMPQDLWYLVYKDENGVVHTVKGSIQGIRRSLKERLLGDASNVRASRTKSGPFEPLRNHPEFRDLVVDLALVTPPSVRKPLVPATKTASEPAATVSSAPTVSAAPVRTPKPASKGTTPAPSTNTPVPLIELGSSRPQGTWAIWVSVFLLAMLAGLGYIFWPLIRRYIL